MRPNAAVERQSRRNVVRRVKPRADLEDRLKVQLAASAEGAGTLG